MQRAVKRRMLASLYQTPLVSTFVFVLGKGCVLHKINFYFIACFRQRIHVQFVTVDAVAWYELAAATSINMTIRLLV